MKKRLLWMILCLLWIPSLGKAALDPALEAQYRAGGGQAIDDYYEDSLADSLEELVPDFSPQKALEALVTGELSVTPSGILHWLGMLLWGELKQNAASFGLLLLLVVLCSAVGQLDSLGSEGAGGAAGFICAAAMCAVTVGMFEVSVRQSREAIGDMSEFVTVLAPVMAALLAGSGQVTGASLLHPVLYGAASFIINAVDRWLVPAIYGCFLLCIANALSEGGKLDGLIGLVKNAMKWILGAILTVFSGLSAVYSVTGQNVDVMVSRTARFAVGNFVPVVGGMLSESVELVLSFSSVLRKGVGISGMIILLLVFAHVAVTLTLQLWMFRVGAAFSSPLGSPVFGKLLSDAAGCIGMMLAVLFMCAVLFCLILIMMIAAGGGGVM